MAIEETTNVPVSHGNRINAEVQLESIEDGHLMSVDEIVLDKSTAQILNQDQDSDQVDASLDDSQLQGVEIDNGNSAESKPLVEKLPSSMKYIMGNELCERFSFYGLRTIQQEFLVNFMGYGTDTATVINHAFVFAAYAFPLLGAYLADEKIGKFKTILYFSLIYCVGMGFHTLTAVPSVVGEGATKSPWALVLGLVLVALGTGGIKSAVSSFCGDQVKNASPKMIQKIFNFFYWSINFGSFFSTILTPLLRRYVSYWVAFLVPSILMAISTVIFVLGRKSYIYRPTQGSVLSRTFCIIGLGIKERTKAIFGKNTVNTGKEFKIESWVDYAKVKYDHRFVDAVKAALRVCLIFVPLPVFWALYNQTSSRWIDSGYMMNQQVGSVVIDADLMQAANPLFIMIFVPIFEYGLYKPLAKRGINFSHMSRMIVGMWLSVAAFIIAMFVQIKLDNEPGSLNICWQIPQYLVLTWSEILVSITGLEFAYSQAPASMKSIIMALFQLTNSIGNVFVIFVVSAIKITPQWKEYLLFSCVMAGFCVIFMFIAWTYKPISDPSIYDYNENEQDPSQMEFKDEKQMIEMKEQQTNMTH